MGLSADEIFRRLIEEDMEQAAEAARQTCLANVDQRLFTNGDPSFPVDGIVCETKRAVFRINSPTRSATHRNASPTLALPPFTC